MATGDLKNNLRKLQFELKTMKYSRDVDFESLGRGSTAAFLPIYHFAFTEYSCVVAEKILEMQLEMYSKTDLRFMEIVYKVLRELFAYKPTITKDQFFNAGFGERKVMMCSEVLHLVQELHKTLTGVKMSAKRFNQSAQSSSKKSLQVTLEVCPSSTPDASAGATEQPSHSAKHDRGGKRLSMNVDLLKRPSPWVPLPCVVNEVSAAGREPALHSVDSSHMLPPSSAPAKPGSKAAAGYGTDSGDSVALAEAVEANLMKLTETTFRSQEEILNNICEKLSQLTSRILSVEERLDRCQLTSATVGCPPVVSPAAAISRATADTCQTERLLENVFARLTLTENRLLVLEKQQNKPLLQPLFPALDIINANDGKMGVMNNVLPSSPATLSAKMTLVSPGILSEAKNCPSPVTVSEKLNHLSLANAFSSASQPEKKDTYFSPLTDPQDTGCYTLAPVSSKKAHSPVNYFETSSYLAASGHLVDSDPTLCLSAPASSQPSLSLKETRLLPVSLTQQLGPISSRSDGIPLSDSHIFSSSDKASFSPFSPASLVADPTNRQTKKQSERIEELIRDTEELMLKNLKRSAAAAAATDCSPTLTDKVTEIDDVKSK